MYHFNDLAQACKVLFGHDLNVDQQFLLSLSTAGLKQAYRKRALATHPDRFVHLGETVQAEYAHVFGQVSDAYQKLSRYLSLRSAGSRNHRIVTGPEAKFWKKTREHVWTPPGTGSTGGQRIYDPNKVPNWPVRTGEYLYFAGVVNWKTLISALVWQRHERETVGEIASRWGWLSEAEILALLSDRKRGERIGDILVRHRLVNPFQLAMLLKHQEKTQKPLGRFFIEQGFFSEPELERYLQDLRSHNTRWNP